MRQWNKFALAMALALVAGALEAQEIKFGDDSGDYPNDDECDDRRFVGPGMVANLDWTALGKDASDCREALQGGRVSLWNQDEARAATSCAAIKWGDDSSEYANDGVCDDPRYEGIGAAGILVPDDAGRDATDCRTLCEYGLIYLRDY